MAEFCKRGVELLKEIVNHDANTLSSYNVSKVEIIDVVAECSKLNCQLSVMLCRVGGTRAPGVW